MKRLVRVESEGCEELDHLQLRIDQHIWDEPSALNLQDSGLCAHFRLFKNSSRCRCAGAVLMSLPVKVLGKFSVIYGV